MISSRFIFDPISPELPIEHVFCDRCASNLPNIQCHLRDVPGGALQGLIREEDARHTKSAQDTPNGNEKSQKEVGNTIQERGGDIDGIAEARKAPPVSGGVARDSVPNAARTTDGASEPINEEERR